MKNDSDAGSELASAIESNKNNKIWEWTLDFLQNHEKNQVVVEDIQKREIVKILFLEYPLRLLSRTEGPLNGETEPEPISKWLDQVRIFEAEIKNKHLPPPIIATDFWQKLYIVDGNHRHEALLKSGFKTYWTIFLLENPDSEKKILEELKKTMKIKAIIVDVGGVLVREINKSARKTWATKLNLTQRQLTKEVFRTGKAKLATVGKIGLEEIWLDIKNKFGLTEEEITNFKQDFHAGDKLNNEFYAFMQGLNQQYKVAILSNTWLDSRKIYTEIYHLDKIVDLMIISAEEGMRKPNKNIFNITLNRLGVHADEAIYVDDRADNIKTANELGMKTVLFEETEAAIEKIKSFL